MEIVAIAMDEPSLFSFCVVIFVALLASPSSVSAQFESNIREIESRQNTQRPIDATTVGNTQRPIATTGNTQRPIATTGNTQRPIATTGNTQRPIATTGNTQRPIATTGNTQRPIATTGNTQRPIATTTTGNTQRPIVTTNSNAGITVEISTPKTTESNIISNITSKPIQQATTKTPGITATVSTGTTKPAGTVHNFDFYPGRFNLK